MAGSVPITFHPSGATTWVTPGTTVLEAARGAGVMISAPCAGRGVCGSCGVTVLEGDLGPLESVERAGLKRAPDGVRLACRATILGPVTVKPLIPLAGTASTESFSEPHELVAAVDFGTTSVSAVVISPASGHEVGRATVANEQTSWGSDVLSRMSASIGGQDDAVRSAGERSIVSALKLASGGAPHLITRVVVASNTAMAALLLGVDVTSLATHPFQIPSGMSDASVGTSVASVIAPGGSVYLVPPLAGFVGGDLVTGLLATNLRDSVSPSLLVDIGTNAEVALVSEGDLYVASAPAGPAFEGGGISCGGPAVEGAVLSAEVDSDGGIRLTTIGGGPARWFTGAGLLSAMLVLRETGHVGADGLLHEKGPLASRFEKDSDGVLGISFGTADGGLRISQLDIRELQLAKAAVRTGIEMVLGEAKVKARSLGAVHIAGAFGTALPPLTLVALGIVPKQAKKVIISAGNTALAGAAAIALDSHLVESLSELVSGVRHVELASDQRFTTILMNATSLSTYSA